MSRTRKKLKKEFKKITADMEQAYQKKDYEQVVCCTKFLTNFYYQVNYKLADDKLEKLISDTAFQYLGTTYLHASNDKIVVFYDGFGLAARGLSNIYVKALRDLDYQVVWIIHEYAAEVKKIVKRYQNDEKIIFELVPKLHIMDRMKYLQNLLLKYMPGNIFIYTTPNDVEGIGVFSTVEGNAKRYLIDLTDHAYWLGKCAADYFVGFRNYGCNIAMQYRGIEKEKMLILPYYPEKREANEYKGMPFGDKEYIFSGGSVYKLEGDDTYKNMVVHILNKYPQLYFVYAGDNGESETLDELGKCYAGRFFRIAEREDLDEVLQHAKFFLATYPISGGLMIQYALQNGCYPLCLCHDVESNPGTWLLNSEKIDFVFYSTCKLYEKVDLLMKDDAYYQSEKEKLGGFVISDKEFTENLQMILQSQKTSFDVKREKIDLKEFLETYKKNMTCQKFYTAIDKSNNKWLLEKYKERN